MKRITPTAILLCGLLAATPSLTLAQSPGLEATILKQDADFFAAFNTCDFEGWKSFLAEDVEFYQDNDNVTTSRDALEPAFKGRCADPGHPKLRRERIAEGASVHPIQGFGAVQFGSHKFWIVNAEKPDQLAATPKFVHLWRLRAGHWQITRVISYSH